MTSAARALVDELRRLHHRRQKPRQSEPRIPVLRALAKTEDPEALSAVLRLLYEPGDLGAVANETAEALLNAAPLAQLAGLERRLRHDLRYDYGAPTPSRYALTRGTPPRFARLALASFHPDGHVREAAVRGLDRVETGAPLPYLLLRLNDWVEPVRSLAFRILERRLTDSYLESWVRALPVLVGLDARQRPESGLMLSRVLQLLSRSERADALDGALTDPDRATRRAAHRFARRARGDLALRAAHMASGDGDLRIRLDTARSLHRGDLVAPDLALRLTRDAAMGVRREALLALVAHDWPGADDAIEAALLDVQGALRDTARYYALKRASGERAFAPMYREALAEAATRDEIRTALGGLSQTGTPEDAALAMPHLTDHRAAVRAAALTAVGSLAPERYAEAIVAALRDASTRVVRTAARRLAAGEIPGVDLEAALADGVARGQPGPARQVLLSALADLPTWAALPHLLRATTTPDTRERAHAMLQSWLSASERVFTRPMPPRAAAIQTALHEAREAGLPPDLADALQARLDRAA